MVRRRKEFRGGGEEGKERDDMGTETYLTLGRMIGVEEETLVITGSPKLFPNAFELRGVKREDKCLFVVFEMGMELI